MRECKRCASCHQKSLSRTIIMLRMNNEYLNNTGIKKYNLYYN